jgi:hypothetical protein
MTKRKGLKMGFIAIVLFCILFGKIVAAIIFPKQK